MARVMNLMADWKGSGRYRGVIPSVALARLGHEVLCTTNVAARDRDGDLFGATAAVWIGHRIDGAAHSQFFQALCRSPRTAMTVLDVDDNVWDVHPSNPACGLGSPERFAENCVHADVVTVCSHGLAEIVTAHAPGARVHVLPNVVPDALLDIPREDAPLVPRVVWSASSSHVLDLPVLRRVLPRVPVPFTFRLLGQGFDCSWLPVERTEYGPWTDDLSVYWSWVDGDVGVAPLVDDVFNYGKSDLKIVEFMARGMAFVASRIGPYAEVAPELHGRAGLFVSSDDEWVDAVTTLCRDRDLSARMGAHGKEWVTARRLASHGAAERERLFRIGHLRGVSLYGEQP